MTRLAAVRERMNLTQAELAARVGLSAGYMSRVERGEKRPAGARMLIIAKALGTTVEALFGTEQEMFPPVVREFVGSELDKRIFSSHEIMGSEMLRASRKIEDAFGGRQNNVLARRLRSDSLMTLGYMPGDFVLIDYRDPTAATAGDIVEAEVEHETTHKLETLLRRLDPPFLMPASPDPRHRAHTLGPHIKICGIVVASWRVRGPEPELLEAEPAEAG